MPVPFPTDAEVNLDPPGAAEVDVIVRAIATATAPAAGLTEVQRLLLAALTESMTGFAVRLDASTPTGADPLGPGELADALASRDEQFRTRIMQVMLLLELVLVPLPRAVTERVERYAAELGIGDDMMGVARRYAQGSLGLALIDFDRSGYTTTVDPRRTAALHTSALAEAWQMVCEDPELAARWASLGDCPEGSLGRGVWQFYRARGFVYPGLPGSAPPLLAQHDWVHVLADYGSTVECEIEVFGLIARAIPDPRGFSLLAMVIGLFETGYLAESAGIFEYDRGHLSRDVEHMAVRLADATYRGAICGRDLLQIDWFEHAERPVDDVRGELGIPPRSARAIAAGAVTPWESGGISQFQLASGRRAAVADGRDYESFGAAADR